MILCHSLSIQGEGAITIEGVKEAYAADRTSYMPTGVDITIRGAVQSITCSYTSELSVVDITNSETIEKLSLKNSGITDLRTKGVSSLKSLICGFTPISTLDLSGCTGLKKLESGSCMKLTSVTLTGCTALEEIELQNGEIAALDLTGLTKLNSIDVSRNPLKTLKLTGLSSLTTLDCKQSGLASLDLSDCTALEYLTANACAELASVKLPESDKLKYIYLQECKLQEIDLSNHASLTQVYLERNKMLTKVSAANCAGLKLLSLHLCALPAEATVALLDQLSDHSAEYDETSPAYKIFAAGIKVTYKEGNVWSPKAASLARRKGWALLTKDENSYESPRPLIDAYAKVTIEETEHGKIALELSLIHI